MRKIWEIIKREYLTRVRKRTFLVMTIVGPLVFAGIIVAPILLMDYGSEAKTIAVIDDSALVFPLLESDEKTQFIVTKKTLTQAKQDLKENKSWDALLYIEDFDLEQADVSLKVFSEQNASVSLTGGIKRKVKAAVKDEKLRQSGLSANFIADLEPSISLEAINIKEGKEKASNAAITSVLGLVGAFLIYLFIFLYGAQVMKGVMEEKTSRIVEVIISSVKPFQLMMGKILGLAAVGLTQFLLWVVLTFAVASAVSSVFGLDKMMSARQPNQELLEEQGLAQETEVNPDVAKVFTALQSTNFLGMGLAFVFYFLGGYFLYSSLFAAVGSLADTETDTQQFMLPISAPLILGIIISQIVIQDPNSGLATWASIIPFTSPVVMMVRIPFEPPLWELILSMVLLVAGFIGVTALGGKIYRTGILMYGKKITYKELSKWLFYRG